MKLARKVSVNPEKWERIKELLGSALEKEPADRSSFLRQACGSDDALRLELETLVASYDSEKSEAAEPLARASRIAGDKTGKRIGAYRVIREIGMGGMGTVYLAIRAD